MTPAEIEAYAQGIWKAQRKPDYEKWLLLTAKLYRDYSASDVADVILRVRDLVNGGNDGI